MPAGFPFSEGSEWSLCGEAALAFADLIVRTDLLTFLFACLMIHTLAIANYRSLLKLTIPLSRLNVTTGPNGSGKSNLYRALRLLAVTAQNSVVAALAREGGLQSTFWAGPEQHSVAMKSGRQLVQGTARSKRVRFRLGFGADDFGYAISLGLPKPSPSAFHLDPEIKRETIWAGPVFRPSAALVSRDGPQAQVRSDRGWSVVRHDLASYDSLFGQVADPEAAPEALALRERIRDWRFYDHFRADAEAPARSPQIGTLTPALHHDGRDLAAAIQTIREIGDSRFLDEVIAQAFPGMSLEVAQSEARFTLYFKQDGLLRLLSAAEVSDGTLRFVLWVAALLMPRPPSIMVLNEPETSIQPELIPALARMILHAAERTQVWVVSHSATLVAALESHPDCNRIRLEKELGSTVVPGQGLLDTPVWKWPDEST